MTIEKNIQDGVVTLKVSGRLDTLTAPELEAELFDVLEQATELVFDLADLEYISSAGLRVILFAQNKMDEKGTMKLVNVNDTIMEVFDITGFLDFLVIE